MPTDNSRREAALAAYMTFVATNRPGETEVEFDERVDRETVDAILAAADAAAPAGPKEDDMLAALEVIAATGDEASAQRARAIIAAAAPADDEWTAEDYAEHPSVRYDDEGLLDRKPTAAQEGTPVTTATHAIERTSPKGQPFRGHCIQCGATGLRPSDALKPCPNPTDMTQEDALISVIDPPAAPLSADVEALVGRLRYLTGPSLDGGTFTVQRYDPDGLHAEAADALERLARGLADAEQQIDNWRRTWGEVCDVAAEWRARAEKAEAALRDEQYVCQEWQAKAERAEAALAVARRTLGFLASVIKPGEPWTETCQREYDAALARIDEITGGTNDAG